MQKKEFTTLRDMLQAIYNNGYKKEPEKLFLNSFGGFSTMTFERVTLHIDGEYHYVSGPSHLMDLIHDAGVSKQSVDWKSFIETLDAFNPWLNNNPYWIEYVSLEPVEPTPEPQTQEEESVEEEPKETQEEVTETAKINQPSINLVDKKKKELLANEFKDWLAEYGSEFGIEIDTKLSANKCLTAFKRQAKKLGE